MSKSKYNAYNRKQPRNQRVSARITQETQATIEASNMSYGDALEMVAGILKNDKSVKQYEYDSLKYENEMMKSRIKSNEDRMRELKSQLSDIETYDPDNPVLSRIVANHREKIDSAEYNGNLEQYFNSRMHFLKKQAKRCDINPDEIVDALNELYSS